MGIEEITTMKNLKNRKLYLQVYDEIKNYIIQNQLKNIDQQFDQLFQIGIPEDMRAYLGMTGFKVVIDYHGQVLRIEQPGAASDEGGEE